MPLKKFIPKIAKIRTNRKQTNITLIIAGRAEKREFTTNLSPSFQLTTLKGLKAQSALKAFKLFKA